MLKTDSPSKSSIPVPTSKYIELSAKFRKERKSPLLVLVEDYDDIHFWNRMFECIKDNYSKIDVSILKDSAIEMKDASGNILQATGKDTLMKVEGLGKYKVVAVDADYDLLIDEHIYSQELRDNRFIIHTEYYSIENHLLSPLTISNLSVLKSVSGYLPDIDWDSIFDVIGSNLLNAVKLCVASKARYNTEKANNPQFDYIQIDSINSSFTALNFNPDNYENTINVWKSSFEDDRFNRIQENCHEELAEYSNWSAEDAIHYVQGHTLYGYVHKIIKFYYDPAYSQLVNNVTSRIKKTAEIQNIINRLNSHLRGGLETPELIKKYVYNAEAIDMNDVAIGRIQDNIRRIIEE